MNTCIILVLTLISVLESLVSRERVLLWPDRTLLKLGLIGFCSITATLGFLLVGMGVSTIVPLVYSTAGKSDTMSAGMALAAVSSTGFLGLIHNGKSIPIAKLFTFPLCFI